MTRWAVTRIRLVRAAMFAASLALPVSAPGQTLTAEQGQEIIKELRAIREAILALGRTPTPPQTAVSPQLTLESPGTLMIGRSDAPVTIVEFTDLQCPFCEKFSKTIFPALKERYIDTGIVKYYSRDFPLGMHKMARPAAVAARCAAEQGEYWELRAALLAGARRLSSALIDESAVSLKLDMKSFRQCVASNRFIAVIQQDVDLGSSLQIAATPTFVVGRSAEPFVGEVVVGALPSTVFASKINALRR